VNTINFTDASGEYGMQNFDVDPYGNLYIADERNDGSTSVLYQIPNFTSTNPPSGTPVVYYDASNSPPPNGFYTLTCSDSVWNRVYVNNFNAGGEILSIPITPPVPCLTAEMKILTPNGYVRVDELKTHDLVLTPPHGRAVEIQEIFSSTIRVDDASRPFVIPKDFFGPSVPFERIRLTRNHAFFVNGAWTEALFGRYDLKQDFSSIYETYYHIALPDYETDKLMCNGIAVDSWNPIALVMPIPHEEGQSETRTEYLRKELHRLKKTITA
jgi:hypothetical protein